MVAYDVFICYNSRDRDEAKKVAEKLRGHGLRPWFDEWELRPGLPWQRILEDQIEHISAAAILLGENGTGPLQSFEIEGYIREFLSRGSPVIPVVLPTCKATPEIPLFLKGMTWVDFRRADPDPLAQLVWGVTGQRALSP